MPRGVEVLFPGAKWRSEAGNVTPNGMLGLPVPCIVPFDPFIVGRGRKPVTGDKRIPVAFKKGRGRWPKAEEFRMGSGRRPVIDALKVLVVRFLVGMGKKPELGWVG